MHIVAGLVGGAAPPHCERSSQLASEKYLNKRGKPQKCHYKTSEHFQTFLILPIISGSPCSLDHVETGTH